MDGLKQGQEVASSRSASLVLAYSGIGHFFFHYFAAMYFTIVVALVRDWSLPYHELIELWTPAFVLIGLAALPAGRLADRWSPVGMLVVMFLGMGLSTLACGLTAGPGQLLLALAGVGLFAAIYHPVGISWLVRNSRGDTGKKLAVNGLLGGLGAAAAGGVTGLLLEQWGWRVAFIAPGSVCLLVGLGMAWSAARGRLTDRARQVADGGSASAGGAPGAFLLLLFPMFAIGLIYNTTQALLPKLFEERLDQLVGGNLALVGGLVSLVYLVAAATQLLGGWLADRYALRSVYLSCWLLQVPLLLLMAASGQALLLSATALLVVANTAALPAENFLLARFAPARHQGLAFGVKFVLAFGAGPLGVELIAWVRRATGSFELLIYALGVLAALACMVVLGLPRRATAAAAAR